MENKSHSKAGIEPALIIVAVCINKIDTVKNQRQEGIRSKHATSGGVI